MEFILKVATTIYYVQYIWMCRTSIQRYYRYR